MKPYCLFCAGVVLLAVVAIGAADPPGAPTTGKVLVLDNHRILEGDIELVGEQYRVRRDTAETWLPAAKAIALLPDMSTRFAFLRDRTNLKIADERLKLASWCYVHGLADEAVQQAQAAVDLQPNYAQAQTQLRQYRQAAARPKDSPRPFVEPAKFEPLIEPPAATDCSPEATKLFVVKIQPLLMNHCATCHAGGREGSFPLQRVQLGSATGQKATQSNLAWTLKQLDRKNPLASPLLVRSVTQHGQGTTPPIRDKQAVPYRLLENWVRMTAGNGGPIDPPAPADKPAESPNEATPPEKPRTPDDPFDPSGFNRPKKNG